MGPKTNGKRGNSSSKSRGRSMRVYASTSSERNDGDSDGKFSKRKLHSNWSQYVDLPADSEDQCRLDFAKFVDQQPSMGDSHFSFSDEKHWELKYIVSDYFKLNVKDLQNDILSVPLHERLQLDSKLLGCEQVTGFVNSAAIHQANVNEFAPLTQEISNKVLCALKETTCKTELPISDIKIVEDDHQTWNSASSSQQNHCVKHKLWDESSENFFSLQDVNQELDHILSIPTTRNNYQCGDV